MREINLDRLRTLLTVADLGSFAAAAKVLHLAPPTVTLHVAQLEERLGTRLLHRAPAGVTATSAGSRYSKLSMPTSRVALPLDRT